MIKIRFSKPYAVYKSPIVIRFGQSPTPKEPELVGIENAFIHNTEQLRTAVHVLAHTLRASLTQQAALAFALQNHINALIVNAWSNSQGIKSATTIGWQRSDIVLSEAILNWQTHLLSVFETTQCWQQTIKVERA
ncbi:hypothetical protein, partial [Pseudoalteromonas sp. S16_S37]|uniref:hypothetical protein n=1 Tax=Pseudoalteromonas sp. S16_S37 TaxID=2720228 RepID=UPI001680B9EC